MSIMTEQPRCVNDESSPEWEPEFEHIDWNDIVDAEENGDFDKLKTLKDKSMELKRSFRCPSPVPPNVGYGSPCLTPKAPHNTPLSEVRPFEGWDDYPSLTPQTTEHPPLETSSPNVFSYAEALGPRLSKRTMSERTCLSPIDFLPKRSALSNLIKTPTDGNCNRKASMGKKQCEAVSPTCTKIQEPDVMDIGVTPDNDSRPNKAAIAVQRRLFPPSKENMEPVATVQEPTPDARSRASSVSSNSAQIPLTDHRIDQRQKQLEFGKNTLGYQRYIQMVPKWQRTRTDPWTPDKMKHCSTRAWQGQIRVWRRALHKYDPPHQDESSLFTAEEAALCHMEIPCQKEN